MEEPQQPGSVNGDISGVIDSAKQYGASLYLLLTHRAPGKLDRRIPALRMALGAMLDNQSFKLDVETGVDYLEAAEELAARGFKLILFGHTHLPKDIGLNTFSARYINTGTWADMIKFDKALLSAPSPVVTKNHAPPLSPFEIFVEAIASKDFSKWIDFSPHYARIEFVADADGSERLANAELRPFRHDDRDI